MQNAKQIASATLQTIAFLAMLDLMILFASLGQIALEGRTGNWNPFWRAQAEVVVRLMAPKEKEPALADTAPSQSLTHSSQQNHSITKR